MILSVEASAQSHAVARHGVVLLNENKSTDATSATPNTSASLKVKYSVVWETLQIKSSPIWEHSYSGENCKSRYTLHLEPPGHALVIDSQGYGSFSYTDNSIQANWNPVGTGPMHYFNGLGLAVWLEQQGVACIHANVLATNKGAIGLIGGSTIGKSTLTAKMLARGFTLLSDDMLALHDAGKQFFAYPGEPRLRMWSDSIEACGLGDPEQWPRVHTAFEKHIVPVEALKNAKMCANPKKVIALYLLERCKCAEQQPSIEEITPIGAVMALVANSSALDIPRVLGVEEARFERMARLVRQIRVRKLLIPPHLSSMERVCELLESDLDTSYSVSN